MGIKFKQWIILKLISWLLLYSEGKIYDVDRNTEEFETFCESSSSTSPKVYDEQIQDPLAIFEENKPQCPPNYKNYTELELCYRITNPKIFNDDECVTSGSRLIFLNMNADKQNILLELLLETDYTNFWLPCRRDGYSIEGCQWKLPPLPTLIALNNTTTDDLSGHCLLMDAESEYGNILTRLEDCNKTYPMMCLYDLTEKPMIKLNCPDGGFRTRYQSASGTDSCFGVVSTEKNQCPLASRSTNISEAENILKFLLEEHAIQESDVFKVCSLNENGKLICYRDNTNMTGSVEKQISVVKIDLDQSNSTEIVIDMNGLELQISLKGAGGVWIENEFKDLYQPKCFKQFSMSSIIEIENMEEEEDEKWKWTTELTADVGIFKIWCEVFLVSAYQTLKSNILVKDLTDESSHKSLLIFAVNFTFWDCTSCSYQDVIRRFGKNSEDLSIPGDDFPLTSEPKEIIDFNKTNGSGKILCHLSLENGLNMTYHMNYLKDHYNKTMPSKFRLENIYHTKYCVSMDEKSFPTVQIGGISLYKKMCITADGIKYSKSCNGDRWMGAKWDNEEFNVTRLGSCHIDNISDTTKSLQKAADNLEEPKSNVLKNIEDIKEIIDSSPKADLKVTDIQVIGQAIASIAQKPVDELFDKTSKEPKTLNDVLNIVDDMSNGTKFDAQKVKIAQETGNSTNSMMYSVDDIIQKYCTSDAFYKQKVINGTYTFHGSSMIVICIDRNLSNVTGVGVYRNSNDNSATTDFKNHEIQHWSSNQTDMGENIPNANRLDVGSIINGEISNGSKVIVFTFYFQSKLFQAATTQGLQSDLIASVQVPAEQPRELNNEVSYFFRHGPEKDEAGDSDKKKVEEVIAYRYDIEKEKATDRNGDWKQEKKVVKNSKNNLRYFTAKVYPVKKMTVITIFTGEETNLTKYNMVMELSLKIIWYIGMVSSIFGSLQILILYMNKLQTVYYTLICLALSTQLIIFFVIYDSMPVTNALAFQLMGLAMHFITLVVFFTTVVACIILTHKLHGNVPRTWEKWYNIAIVCYLIPAAIVLFSYALCTDCYIENMKNRKPCFPTAPVLFYGYQLPICLVILFNITMYVRIAWTMFYSKVNAMTSHKATDIHIKCAVFISLLLSLNWIFGVIYLLKENVVCHYLFVITVAFQAFFIFCYEVLMKPKKRNTWLALYGIHIADDPNANENYSKSMTTKSDVYSFKTEGEIENPEDM